MKSFEQFISESVHPEKKKSRDEKFIEQAVVFLKEPINRIVEGLKDDIERGVYSVIIGDDAMGRVPALIMSEIIKTIYKRHNKKPPLVRFIAGSSSLEPRTKEKAVKHLQVTQHVRRMLDDAERFSGDVRSALFVTDMVAYGQSLGVVAEAVKANKWNLVAATVGLERLVKKEDLEKICGCRIVAGEVGTPQIYFEKTRGFSGVRKRPENLFSDPIYAEDQNRISRNIRFSREIARIVAQEILEKQFPDNRERGTA